MASQPVTKAVVLQHLQDVVQQFGEEHKATCFYEYKGQPHCIAGHVFSRLGVSIEQLTHWDDNANGIESHLDDLRSMGWTVEATEVLSAAQMEQDRNCTWGDALHRATYRFEDVPGEGEW